MKTARTTGPYPLPPDGHPTAPHKGRVVPDACPRYTYGRTFSAKSFAGSRVSRPKNSMTNMSQPASRLAAI